MADIHIVKWLLNTSRFSFDLNVKRDKPIEISEQDSCHFLIEIHGDNKPSLQLGDFIISLELVENDDVIATYRTRTIKCFQNFIGLAQAEIIFEDVSSTFKSPAINVFAKKATYERALTFLKMLNEKSDISSICFSVTHLNSDSTKGSKNLSAMLKAGIKALDYFQEQRSRFAQFPCSKTKTRSKVENYSHTVHLDERSIAYLCTHPESLYSSFPNERDVVIGSRNLKINQVETTSHYKDTNIVENQIVLSFLNVLLTYLKSVSRNLKKAKTSDFDLISFDGEDFFSIDKLLFDSGLIISFHQEKIEQAIQNCIRCIKFVEKHIPCKVRVGASLAPVPTQQVLARTHYLNLYELIKDFYDIGEPQWRGQLEFYGLRNLYKIYEFVCLVNLIDSIKKTGYVLDDASFLKNDGTVAEVRPINEPCNFYSFSHGGKNLRLFYEPSALQAKHLNVHTPSGTIVDLVHVSKRTWSPDFVISIQDSSDLEVHILDAKYSNFNSVKEYHLEPCTLKYTTKMMVLNQQRKMQKVDSMTLLFSGDHHSYESYYSHDFSFYKKGDINLNAVKPYIGMLSHNENNLEKLSKFINDIITL